MTGRSWKERVMREAEWGRRTREMILQPNGSQIPIISQEAASPTHWPPASVTTALGRTTLWIATNFFTACTYSILNETCSLLRSSLPLSFLVGNHKLAQRATEKFGVTGFEVASRVIDCRRFGRLQLFVFWVLEIWVQVKSWIPVSKLIDWRIAHFGFSRFGVLVLTWLALGFPGCVVGMAASMATALQAGTTSASRVSVLEVLTYSTTSDDLNSLEFDLSIGRGGWRAIKGTFRLFCVLALVFLGKDMLWPRSLRSSFWEFVAVCAMWWPSFIKVSYQGPAVSLNILQNHGKFVGMWLFVCERSRISHCLE